MRFTKIIDTFLCVFYCLNYTTIDSFVCGFSFFLSFFRYFVKEVDVVVAVVVVVRGVGTCCWRERGYFSLTYNDRNVNEKI